MIIVKLLGGLGNQMFQYALGRKLSLLKDTNLKLDLSHYKRQSPEKTIRNFELYVFKNLNIDIASILDIKKVTGQDKPFILRKAFNFIQRFKKYYKRHVVKEMTKNFDINIFRVPKNVYLIGFWQSYKYFSDIRNVLLNDFSIDENELDLLNRKTLEQIKKSNSVSIHIRRGDYIHNEHYKKVHINLSLEYYRKAINLINKKISNPVFFFFSDDIAYVKGTFKDIRNAYFIDFNKDQGFKDLNLMLHCKHNIIANSSFSWWGAWLNRNPHKIVIAPAKWYKIESFNTPDLLPEEWIKF